MKTIVKIYLLVLIVLVSLTDSIAGENAGTVNALKGKANVLRKEKVHLAKIKDNILKIDTVETKKESRIKLHFTDDSLLTLGENSKLIVKEYIGSTKEKRGQSVYNLIDGKMRAVVGKTKFEVHTPTAVAAARGTGFIIWTEIVSKMLVTGLIVTEHEVDFRNIMDNIPGTVTVREGYVSYARAGESPTKPVPVPPGLLNRMLDQTSIEDVSSIVRVNSLDECFKLGGVDTFDEGSKNVLCCFNFSSQSTEMECKEIKVEDFPGNIPVAEPPAPWLIKQPGAQGDFRPVTPQQPTAQPAKPDTPRPQDQPTPQSPPPPPPEKQTPQPIKVKPETKNHYHSQCR